MIMCCGDSTRGSTGADYRPPTKEVQKAKRELKKRTERGAFFSLPDLKDAWRSDRSMRRDGIKLSPADVQALYSSNNCPCGHCKFYNLEVFPDDRVFFLHHVSDGIFKMGTY